MTPKWIIFTAHRAQIYFAKVCSILILSDSICVDAVVHPTSYLTGIKVPDQFTLDFKGATIRFMLNWPSKCMLYTSLQYKRMLVNSMGRKFTEKWIILQLCMRVEVVRNWILEGILKAVVSRSNLVFFIFAKMVIYKEKYEIKRYWFKTVDFRM